MVEKGDLLGLDYLWEVCLHIPDESIADSAIQLLLNMSYNNLNPRLKKVRVKGACACVCFIVFVFLMLHSYTHTKSGCYTWNVWVQSILCCQANGFSMATVM